MAERQHWSARWLDWGIRGNWLWSVFPSGWKVLIWSVFVGALGALIALIGKTTAIRGWIGSLSSVFVYVVIWAIVQTVGIRTKRLSVGAISKQLIAIHGSQLNSTRDQRHSVTTQEFVIGK